MIDPLARIHGFASTESPPIQDVQFRPHIRWGDRGFWVLKVEVTFCVRKHDNPLLASPDGASTVVWVDLDKANTMAEKYREKGWHEATWM